MQLKGLRVQMHKITRLLIHSDRPKMCQKEYSQCSGGPGHGPEARSPGFLLQLPANVSSLIMIRAWPHHCLIVLIDKVVKAYTSVLKYANVCKAYFDVDEKWS